MKDLNKVVSGWAAEFAQAPKDSPSWFGSDIKTSIREHIGMEKDLGERLQKAKTEEESLGLQKSLKMCVAMRSVMEGIKDGGVASNNFLDAYDRQQTLLGLDPVVDMQWPAFLIWSRHRAFIVDSIDNERWVGKVSSETLTNMIIDKTELVKEQTSLVAERMASLLKGTLPMDKHEGDMDIGKLFSLEREWDLQEEILDFAEALSAWIHHEELDECVDVFNEIMKGAHMTLAKHVPIKGFAGTDLGQALVGYPRGRYVYKAGTNAKDQGELTAQKVEPLQDLSIKMERILGRNTRRIIRKNR